MAHPVQGELAAPVLPGSPRIAIEPWLRPPAATPDRSTVRTERPIRWPRATWSRSSVAREPESWCALRDGCPCRARCTLVGEGLRSVDGGPPASRTIPRACRVGSDLEHALWPTGLRDKSGRTSTWMARFNPRRSARLSDHSLDGVGCRPTDAGADERPEAPTAQRHRPGWTKSRDRGASKAGSERACASHPCCSVCWLGCRASGRTVSVAPGGLGLLRVADHCHHEPPRRPARCPCGLCNTGAERAPCRPTAWFALIAVGWPANKR